MDIMINILRPKVPTPGILKVRDLVACIANKVKFRARFFAFVIAFTLYNITAFATYNLKAQNDKVNSFAWSIDSQLKNIGTTVSLDKIHAYIGTAFSPNLSTGILCLSEAIQADDDAMLTNFLSGVGLKEDRFDIGKKVWSRAIARQFIRKKIRYALAETNIVLMQGGWKSPAGEMDWGIINSIDFNGKLSGETQHGDLPQELSPKKIIILRVNNSSVSPGLFRDQVLRNAVKQLNNSILLQDTTEEILTGYDMINHIADIIHRTPFCPQCKQKSYICLHKILKLIYDDLGSGIRYLNLIEQQCPEYQKKDIVEAANQLVEIRNQIIPFLNLDNLKIIMHDRNRQADMGEVIRQSANHFDKAAKFLAKACNEEIESINVNPVLAEQTAKRDERKLVRTLPLFSRIIGLSNSFFISSTLAAGILGHSAPVKWLIGVSGYPFKFLIESNSFTYVSDLSTGYDSMKRYLNAAGLVPVFYTFGNEISSSAENEVRKEIIKTIDTSAPVIISVPGSENQWGIITGYKDHGSRFYCRLPLDSNYFFSAVSKIPRYTITLKKKKEKPSMHSQTKGALNQMLLLHSQTNFSNYSSGISALNLWIDKCSYYSDGNFMPPLDFARQNQLLWIALRDNLRSTYRFLDIIITVAPELTAPINEARNLYLESVNLMNLTYEDGDVLKKKDGVVYPIDWLGKKSKKQIQTLGKVKDKINTANEHIRLAIKQLH